MLCKCNGECAEHLNNECDHETTLHEFLCNCCWFNQSDLKICRICKRQLDVVGLPMHEMLCLQCFKELNSKLCYIFR